MVEEFNKVPKEKIAVIRPSPGDPESDQFRDYVKSLDDFEDNFAAKVAQPSSVDSEKSIRDQN
jgi:hypothetical protein